jgi:hypothetical protein
MRNTIKKCMKIITSIVLKCFFKGLSTQQYRKQEKNLYLPLMSNPCEHWSATKKLRLHQAVNPIRKN